jgi:hypothetical protein
MTAQTQDRKAWLLGTVAARRLGVGYSKLPSLATRMGIRVRKWPGVRMRRYNAQDIEELIARLEREEAAQVAAARQPRIEKTRTAT